MNQKEKEYSRMFSNFFLEYASFFFVFYSFLHFFCLLPIVRSMQPLSVAQGLCLYGFDTYETKNI